MRARQTESVLSFCLYSTIRARLNCDWWSQYQYTMNSSEIFNTNSRRAQHIIDYFTWLSSYIRNQSNTIRNHIKGKFSSVCRFDNGTNKKKQLLKISACEWISVDRLEVRCKMATDTCNRILWHACDEDQPSMMKRYFLWVSSDEKSNTKLEQQWNPCLHLKSCTKTKRI